MAYKGIGLVFLVLLFAGCASLEEPRWVLLGDTQEKGFYLDSDQVERQANGNYLYLVKTSRYQEGKPHLIDENHDTSKVLYLEMNCRNRQWTQLWSGFMDKQGKILLRRTNPNPTPQTITPESIHFSSYNYLCGKKDLAVQHNH